jgi:hypothetical protein
MFLSFYWDNFEIVKPPKTIQTEEIERLKIRYRWQGLGKPIAYTIEIEQGQTQPLVTVLDSVPPSLKGRAKRTVDKKFVQALRKSLINLIPIRSEFSLTPCTDNYPDWTITIGFTDGTTVELATQGSNMVFEGGPWQVKLGDQRYIHFSTAFTEALERLVRKTALAYGQPLGMACHGAMLWFQNIFELAYP